jgi:hypothetical protein
MGIPLRTGNGVLVVTSTTGTGAYALAAAAAPTFRTLAAAGIPSGARVMYTVQDNLASPTLFEEGEGVYTAGAPDTLSRAQIKGGSNGTSAVNWSAGVKYLFLSIHADRAAILDTDGRLPNAQSGVGRISQVRRGAGFVLPDATQGNIPWDTAVTNSLGVYAGGGPYGQFVVQEDGVYLTDASLTFNFAATGQRRLVIIANDEEIVAARAVASTGDVELSVSKVMGLSAGAVVKVQAFQDRGGDLIVGGNARSSFSLAKIGG